MNAAKLVCDIGKHAVPAFADLGHFPFKQPNLSVVLARTSSINTALQVSDFRTQGFEFYPRQFAHGELLSGQIVRADTLREYNLAGTAYAFPFVLYCLKSEALFR